MSEPLPSDEVGAATRASDPGRTASAAASESSVRSGRAWAAMLVTLALALMLDLWSKHWAFETVAGKPVRLVRGEIIDNLDYRLPFHDGIRVLPMDLLDFRLVLNHGAVFGIGDGARVVFIVFTIAAALAGLWVFARWTTAADRTAHIALGLVLAGGIGNLHDRIVYGAVRDFLHMVPRWHLPFGLHWPGGSGELFPWVFNVADVCLLTGMGLLVLCLNRRSATVAGA